MSHIHGGKVLLCKELLITMKENYIFDGLYDSWKEMKCDGLIALTGKQAGVVQPIKALAPCAISTNTERPCLHDVLANTVKVLNYLKGWAINNKMLTALCEEVSTEYHFLLMNTKVRWLSRRCMLLHLFSWKENLLDFLADKKPFFVQLSNKRQMAHTTK